MTRALLRDVPLVVYVFLAVMLLMDAVAGWMLFAQVRVAGLPTTSGTVTEMSRDRRWTMGTLMNCPQVAFTYRVDGRSYTGRRLRAGGFCSTSWRDANSVVDRWLVGEPATVHYNPDDPAEAYLYAEVGTVEHMGLMFLLPFNAFALGWLLEIASRAFLGRSLTPGVRYREKRGGHEAWLPRVGPLRFALGMLVVLGFFAALGSLLVFHGFTVEDFERSWLGIGVLAAACFVLKGIWNTLRPKRLRFDGVRLTLADGSTLERARFLGSAVRAGASRPPHPTYHQVLVRLRAGPGEPDAERELVELPDATEAARLARWVDGLMSGGPPADAP